MKRFLMFLILVQFVTQTFSLDVSIVRGINLKNAMIYTALAAALFNMAMNGGFRLRLVGVHASFTLLCVYGILTYLVLVFIIGSTDYDPIESVIMLKSNLLDYFIIFLAFFYGVRTAEDAMDVTKAMVLGIVFANLVTVLDTSGILGLNIIPVREGAEAGRVQGALGEANQYGAVIVMLLPATVALIMLSRGWTRLMWTGGALISVAALLVTISRGAIVGLVVGCLAGAVLLRQFVSPGKIIKWAGIGLAVAVLGVIVLWAQYGYLMYERLIVNTFLSDGVDATSGRNVIWAMAVQAMAEGPWSFLSGYGFAAYFNMGFEYASHNDYLLMWFDLGLPGLLSFLAIHAQAVFTGRAAAMVAPAEQRPYMISFVIGWIALCVAIFFVNLYEPSVYMWAYLGISLRLAVAILDEASPSRALAGAAASSSSDGGARLGWSAPRKSATARRGPRVVGAVARRAPAARD